ncbi:MAG: RHS repeat-associated core domain-containing protein, partial [Pyrinomonadaceae bacterium]
SKIRVHVTNVAGDNHTQVVEIEAYNRGNVQWLVADQLGTPRMVFDKTGSLAATKRHDYLPFGEELYAGTGGRTPALGYTGGDGIRQQFTSYERDIETSLDFAQTRYYANVQGRFTSPDPYNIIFEKTKGKDEKEQHQIFLSYVSQPQVWNKFAYTLNNPLKYADPDGRRELTAEDWRRLQRLADEYNKAGKAGDTDLANAIGRAMNEIALAIDAVPEGQQDPSSLRTVFFSIDHLGDTSYATGGPGMDSSITSNGWKVSSNRNDNKCNYFIGVALALGGTLGLQVDGNPSGVPVYGTKGGLGSLWGNGYFPGANEWAAGRVQNFQLVSTPQLGDVAAWGARVGAGHSGIYIGGGATIYANGQVGVKIQTVAYVTADQRRPVSYLRHTKP